jgi:flagellar transcriptional activator FlhC
LTKGYRLYLEHCRHTQSEPVLDLTRAWTLVRFFDADILQLTRCCRCSGKFVAHRHDLQNNVVCGACQPPSRAGKTKKAAAAKQEIEAVQLEAHSREAQEAAEVIEAARAEPTPLAA